MDRAPAMDRIIALDEGAVTETKVEGQSINLCTGIQNSFKTPDAVEDGNAVTKTNIP